MEMRRTALLIFRGARVAVEQTPQTHHVAATHRDTSVAVFAGSLLHCACLLRRCVALSLTEEKSEFN